MAQNKYDNVMTVLGVFGSFASWVQFVEIILSKNAEGVSFISYLLIVFVLSSWLIYGIYIKNFPLIISNTSGVLGSLLCLITIAWFK